MKLPWWFWLFAVCVVLVLILREASKKSPWLAAKFGALGAAAKAFGALGWVRVGALVLLIGAPLAWGAYELIKEQGRAEVRLEQAEENARDIKDVANASIDEGQNFRNDADTLRNARDQGRDEIQNASQHDADALFLAWAAADRRLCNAAGGCGNSGA